MSSKTMNTGVVKLLLVSGTMASVTSALLAAPHGEQVVRGNAQFARNGDLTRITASNGAIINYRSFNIGRSETVQFIQPNSRSRVLNRVLSNDPTEIAGRLLSNGRVWIVNPAGVSIRDGAVVDVGGLYAAAGNISDNDFARGINRFTGLTGTVTNEGTIKGAEVILAGAGVINAGTIDAPKGLVAFAAGDDVLIGEQGGTMYVRVSNANPEAKAPTNGGITNTGTINAQGGTYAAATGDMFAMAIRQGGTTNAANVNISGGDRTLTWVDGKIDATSANTGSTSGGNVTILGEQVIVVSTANIDASGTGQGGSIKIGGGFHGQGTALNASVTGIETGAVVRADATEHGHGGTIAVWSDEFTEVDGTISAVGAGVGNGGLIETSSKITLNIGPSTVIQAQAGKLGGKGGHWLLDPQSMSVINGAGSLNLFTAAGAANDPNNPRRFEPSANAPAAVGVTIIQNALNADFDVEVNTDLAANGTVTDGDINWIATQGLNITSANRILTLSANSDISFTGALTVSGVEAPSFTLRFLAGSDTGSSTAEGVDPANVTVISGAIDLGGGSFIGSGANLQITPTGSVVTSGAGDQTYNYDNLDIRGTLTVGFGTLTIGNTTSTTTLVTSPTITAADGTITFNDEIVLEDDVSLTAGAAGSINFNGSGNVNSASGEFNDLTITDTLNVNFNFSSDVGGEDGLSDNDLGNLIITLSPGGAINFDNSDNVTQQINTRFNQTYNGTVIIRTGGEVVQLRSSEGTITFNGDVQGFAGTEGDLFIGAPNIVFNGNVGQGGAGNVLGTLTLRNEASAASAAALTTINSTAWNLRSLDAGTTVRVANGGLALDIASDSSTFQFELQTDDNLTDLSFVGAGFNNDADFQGSVGLAGGSNVAFGSLRVAGQATLREEISVNTTNAGGATGDQTYEGAVIIDDNPNIASSNQQAVINATGGTVTFASTVDDAGSSSAFRVNGREVLFQDLVGNSNDIDGLHVIATQRIVFSFTGSSTTGITVGNDNGAQPGGASFTAPRIELATAAEFLIENEDSGAGTDISFNGLVADVGNGTDWMNVENSGGRVLFNGNVGTGLNEAIGRLVVTADTIEFRSTVLSTDAGGFDGDQIYNGNVVLNSAGRTHRFAYIGAVHALGTSADLGATSAVIDPTFGFGDISFRGTINSFDNGVSNINNGMLVETSGRREFQGSIGTGTDRSFLAFLTTGGDANIVGADPVANPGIDLLGDTALSAITIKTFANTDGTNTGNISFWGPTYLDNDVTFFLGRNGGPGGTDDIAGERELTFTRSLDSFDATLRNLDVSTSFRTWFRGDVGNGNTSGGAVPGAGRLLTSDVTAEDIFRGVIFGGTPADAWIRLGEESTGGASSYLFLTNSPAGVDVVAQRFNGPVRLDSDVTVDDDNNGDIIFETIVDSFDATAQDLTVNTGGKGWFRGNVGLDFFILDEIDTDSAQENADDGTYLGFEGNTIELRTSKTSNSNPFGSSIGNAIDFDDRVFLDGDAIVAPQGGGGVHFHDIINTSNTGADTGLHALTVNCSGTGVFFADIGQVRALRRFVTDVPGFTRFGVQSGAFGDLFLITTNGATTDIGDPVSLDADLQITELSDVGVVRFRGSINSFDANSRALRILTPAGARTELWGNIGTGFIASGSGGDPDGSSGVPNDAVNRALRFIQTDGFGITQLGNNSDNIGANVRNAAITIRTAGDPQTGDITSNNSNAIDMQDAVLLDANYTFDTQNARNLRFYETINSLVTDGVNHLTATNRSLTINNTSGNIAFDDNIGTIGGTAGRLSFILTDTNAITGLSGTVRLGNSSGLNGVLNIFSNSTSTNDPDGAAINIQTSAAGGVQLGDQFIDLDADIEIDALASGTVNFGANALTGKVNSLDRPLGLPGNTDNNSAANGDDLFRGLTVNTAGATRFFNTVGQQSFTGLAAGAARRRLAYIRTDYVLNSEVGTVGSGTTRFDSDVFVQGRESAVPGLAPAVGGQQRRIGITINDTTIIGDNTELGTTVNGVTFDSNFLAGHIRTGSGGGAMRFRGNVTTDGTSRNMTILTDAQTFTRSQFFALAQAARQNWVTNMLAPVAFGGDVGSSAGGARFASFTINQPGGAPFGLRGTGLNADIGNVPMTATIFWANGSSAWGVDDAWSLSTASVGPLNTALNTTTFDVFTSGNIDFGQNEKGTAYGNLELKSSGGQIFIGDLNAVGAKGAGNTSGRLIVGEAGNTFAPTASQKRIMSRTRTGSRVTKWDDGILKSFTDQGVDYVANRINFKYSPARVAAGTNVNSNQSKTRIQFATPSGDGVTIAGQSNPSFIVRFFREELFPRQFVNGSDPKVFLFDLPAKGISQAEKATAWAKEGWLSAPHEVWPAPMSHFNQLSDMDGSVHDPVLLTSAERKSLEGINIMTRTQTPAQMMDNMIGRELFNDRPNATDAAGASDQARAISLPRLNKKAASALAAEAQRLLSGGGDTSKAMALIDQLGVNPTEAAAMKAALSRRFSGGTAK